jgi:hypothetical protein
MSYAMGGFSGAVHLSVTVTLYVVLEIKFKASCLLGKLSIPLNYIPHFAFSLFFR